MNKKSQLSILIIVGVIMLIMMLVFFTFKSENDVGKLEGEVSVLNPGPVKEHVNLCIGEIVIEGMWKYGVTDLSKLEGFVEDNLLECVVDLNEYSAGSIILAGRVESSILLTNNDEFITVDVNMPLSIESGEQSVFLDKFKVKTLVESKVDFDLGSVAWVGSDYSSKNVESSLSVAPGGIGIEFT